MTDDELNEIEAQANKIDWGMSSECIRLVTCLKACRAARASERRQLQAEVDRARVDLEKYGQHHYDCMGRRGCECTCGFAATLTEEGVAKG